MVAFATAWSGIGRESYGPKPMVQAVQQKVDHRRRVQRERLRHEQAAYNGDAQGPTQFRAGADRQRERYSAKQRRHCGHEDWPESFEASFEDGLLSGKPAAALS